MVKLNSSDEYELLCKVTLTKDEYPTAFENKVRELIEECGMSREQAEESIENMEIELELYYEKGYGLFAVDSEAVTAGTIHSPYSGELCIEPHKI